MKGEALVVEDPQSRIFIVRNDGFVAYGVCIAIVTWQLRGTFKILACVDTLNLGPEYAIRESDDRTRVLGYMRSVHASKGGVSYSAATFFDIPANNVLLLQRGNEIITMGAGQHVVINPWITFRNLFSLGERQTTFKVISPIF